jgi:DNA-binding transcriptional regulator YhcF (GntR family)
MSTAVTELHWPIPLYMQVVRQLRAQIAAGNWRRGTGCRPSGR